MQGVLCIRQVLLKSSLNDRCFPEQGFNSEFAHFVDEHNKVMTEHFAKRLVDHRNVSLAA